MSHHRLILTLLLYAFGVPAFTPSVPILLARFSPERFRGRIIAMDAWVMSVARILSPALLGLMYEHGPLRAFRFSSFTLFVAAGLMASQRHYVKRQKNRDAA
eukprot:g18832.t1